MRPAPAVNFADAAVLDALAAQIDRILDVFDSVVIATKWQAVDGSPCNLEGESLRRKFGPSGSWTDEAAATVVGYSNVQLAVAAQHLEGIRVLLEARQVIFPLVPLTRSVLEIGGYISWLLDPEAGVRERAARSYLARLEDAKRARAAAKGFRHNSTEHLALTVKALLGPELHARFYKSEITYSNSGNLILLNQKYPGLSGSLKFAENLMGGDPSSRNTAGMYTWLSNATHPTPAVAKELMVRVGDLYRFELEDSTYPYRIARAAITLFVQAWKLLAAYLGYDQELPTRLGLELDSLPQPPGAP